MARPLKEGFDYFPHDVDMSDDEKIEAIEVHYGDKGYSWTNKLYERMYRNGNGTIDLSNETNRKVLIQRKLKTTDSDFDEFMEKAIEIGLFDKDTWENKKIIMSQGVMKRRESMLSHRKRAREFYANKTGKDTNDNKPKKEKRDYSSFVES